MKNTFSVSLHLEGSLPATDVLIALFGPTMTILRRGERHRRRDVLQDQAFIQLDVWKTAPLDERAVGTTHFESIATRLVALAPALHQLQHPALVSWVRVGMVRRTD